MSDTSSATESVPSTRKPWQFNTPKGTRPAGRAKGTPNRYNGDIKRMVCAALELAGGVQYLCDQAKKNPVAFMGLVGRVLPLQVTGPNGGKLHITYSWADETPVQPVPPAPLIIEANVEPEPQSTNDAVSVTFDE